MNREEKQLKTTAIPNALLNDANLSAGEKITYILLMKYERFEKNNSGSFFTWSETYLSRKASKKYLASLLAKEYIDENNNFYYFDNGERKDYNGQSFSTTFKTVSFFPVKEELLFAKSNGRSLTPEQKLFLIFFDRDRCDTRQGWHPHFTTYEKFGLKNVYDVKDNLLEKNIISYEVRYLKKETKSLKQTFISKIKIAYLEEVTEAIPEVEYVKIPENKVNPFAAFEKVVETNISEEIFMNIDYKEMLEEMEKQDVDSLLFEYDYEFSEVSKEEMLELMEKEDDYYNDYDRVMERKEQPKSKKESKSDRFMKQLLMAASLDESFEDIEKSSRKFQEEQQARLDYLNEYGESNTESYYNSSSNLNMDTDLAGYYTKSTARARVKLDTNDSYITMNDFEEEKEPVKKIDYGLSWQDDSYAMDELSKAYGF